MNLEWFVSMIFAVMCFYVFYRLVFGGDQIPPPTEDEKDKCSSCPLRKAYMKSSIDDLDDLPKHEPMKVKHHKRSKCR
jgi:hypothetical protein